MADDFAPVTLSGRDVRLEPLSRSHHDGLVEAVDDGRLWEIWYTRVPSPRGMADEIERRLAEQDAGRMIPFTVIQQDQAAATERVVGMTTMCGLDATNRRVEVG